MISEQSSSLADSGSDAPSLSEAMRVLLGDPSKGLDWAERGRREQKEWRDARDQVRDIGGLGLFRSGHDARTRCGSLVNNLQGESKENEPPCVKLV